MGRNWLLESHEDVQFTVYRPRVVVPERWEPLLAFAHLSERSLDAPGDGPDPLEEVARQARGVLGDQIWNFSQIRQDPVQGVPAEAEISLVPELPGFRIEPPMRTFRWIEEVHREEFKIRAGAELNGQVARGRLTVFLGRIVLAEGPLAIRVDRAASASASASLQPTETASVQPFRRIFASYSHRDEAVVVELERYARVLGDRYLRDVRDLRAGEAWSERLEELIRTADVFQLFWSWNALRSPFVEREWRYALSLGRPHFVRPTYWEEPFPEDLAHKLPPDELRRLHFQLLRGGAGSHSLPTAHLLDDTATAERVHAEDPPTVEAQLLENSAVREGATQWVRPAPPGEHGDSATAIGGGKELSSPGSSQANQLQPSPIASQTLPSGLPTGRGAGIYLAVGLALAVIGVASFLGSRSGIKGSALRTPDAPIQSPGPESVRPPPPIPEPRSVNPMTTELPPIKVAVRVKPPPTASAPPPGAASPSAIASASAPGSSEPIAAEPAASVEVAEGDRFKGLEETIASLESLSEQTRDAYADADLGGSIGDDLNSFAESAVDLRKTYRRATGTGIGIARVIGRVGKFFHPNRNDLKALEDRARDLVRKGEEIDRLAASDPLGPAAGEHWQEVKRQLKRLNQYF